MNNFNGIGRLTKEPDVRYSQDGKAVARFSIAIDTGYGDKKRTDFPNIVCFGKTAENVEKFVHKGSQVGVTGRLQTGSYDGKNGKVYTTDIIADRIEFLSKPKNENNQDDIPDGFQQLDEDVPF